MSLDLNCDLGEGESLSRTRALMRWVTSANVACGGHAGDVRTMRACARLTRRLGVRLGAHPGPPSREHLGRGALLLTANELELLLLQQVGVLERIAREEGVQLHHLKLHGSLYHAVEASAVLARRYLLVARRWWPRCVLYVRAGGTVERLARRTGVRVWAEAFADRAYRADGTLVPRDEPGAILTERGLIVARVRRLETCGELLDQSGGILRLRARTLCLHSDTPGAVRLARAIASALDSS